MKRTTLFGSIAVLKERKLDSIDWENLIEEVLKINF